MKNISTSGVTPIILGLLFMLSSCEKPQEQTKLAVFFKIGIDQTSDSTILLLRLIHSYHLFQTCTERIEEILQVPLRFFDKEIHLCRKVCSGYSSFIPAGPMIPSRACIAIMLSELKFGG